ncbi:MAG TPA: hypothetical protein VMJ66_16575 [Geobacteraceae bacterium]|nr:hypothetical protein [Geobacteraceae bacterium]
MNHCLNKYFAIIFLLAAILACAANDAFAGAAPFSFDSIWFYRDGTRVVPEISRRWLTVVFDSRYVGKADEFASDGGDKDGFIQKKARSIVKSHDRLSDFLYDPNIAEDACFFRMRDGAKLEDVKKLIDQLSRDGTVRYVHPTLVMDNKTFAFFNLFEMEWKTGIGKAQRQTLLSASHAKLDEKDEKEKRYTVDVTAIPFFRAVNLLAEDVRVLKVIPSLVEVKPSISARLSLFMSGGNIGDSIPFTLTITFSDRVSIDPSSIATLDLRPPEIQKELFDCVFDPYDYAKAVTRSPIVITGHVRFYAPGEFTIPPIKISYSCPSCSNNAGNSVRSIETEAALFKVSSIIPTEKSQNRLIVPTEPVSADFRLAELHRQSLLYLWLAIISFAALIPCAIWLLLIRRKAGAEQRRHREKKKDGQLAERLRTLLKETPAAPHWSYLGEVGTLLREYMAALYGIDSKYKGGSGKKFVETIAAHLPGECIAPLGSVLAAIDNSVALETEHYQDIEHLQSDILKIVDLTAQNGGQG